MVAAVDYERRMESLVCKAVDFYSHATIMLLLNIADTSSINYHFLLRLHILCSFCLYTIILK